MVLCFSTLVEGAGDKNLTDAVAGGLLKSSPALAERLTAAEVELARLRAASSARTPKVSRIVPRVAERYRALVARLDATLGRDPERARAALQDAIGSPLILRPDESRKFLWAEYEMKTAALVGAAVGSEIMVAGARFANYRRRVALRNQPPGGPAY